MENLTNWTPTQPRFHHSSQTINEV